MHRALALALAVAPLLAACESEEAQPCPGEPVAPLSFSGSFVTVADPAFEIELDPSRELPDCAEALGFRDAVVAFQGTLARAAAGPSGALCRTTGQILFGSQSGDRWAVEGDATRAVLSACGATCAASSRTVIAGDVLRDEDGPIGFRGVLVEVLSPLDASCGACVLPCAARYALAGTVEGR